MIQGLGKRVELTIRSRNGMSGKADFVGSTPTLPSRILY